MMSLPPCGLLAVVIGSKPTSKKAALRSFSSRSSAAWLESGGRSPHAVFIAPFFCAVSAAWRSSSKENPGRNFCDVVSLWLPRLAQNSFA